MSTQTKERKPATLHGQGWELTATDPATLFEAMQEIAKILPTQEPPRTLKR